MVAQGLSIIFISHKLNEVMAVSDRVLVLRAGQAGRRAHDRRHDAAGAGGADGRPEVTPPPVEPAITGPALLVSKTCRLSAGRSGTPLDRVTLPLHSGEITGLAGVSGNGQAALAGLLSGTEAPISGSMVVQRQASRAMVAGRGPVHAASPASPRTATPSARSAT